MFIAGDDKADKLFAAFADLKADIATKEHMKILTDRIDLQSAGQKSMQAELIAEAARFPQLKSRL